jgi:hypothetical protein
MNTLRNKRYFGISRRPHSLECQLAIGIFYINPIQSHNEMKRINIELSFNLARLIQLLHEDEERFNRLLCLSYRYLPMPQVLSLQSTRILDSLTGLTSPDFYNGAQPDLRERMDHIRPATHQYPCRIIANAMAVTCYRNE